MEFIKANVKWYEVWNIQKVLVKSIQFHKTEFKSLHQ